MRLSATMLDRIGQRLAGFLLRERPGREPFTPSDPEELRRSLRPGDVVLVAGSNRVSTAIKYLTHSTWSHAALYVGNVLGPPKTGDEPHTLIEVVLDAGCRSIPLSNLEHFHTRICRPVGLTDADRRSLVDFMISRLGIRYDTRNIIDLARYLLPTLPVPSHWRRRMIALGSGEPTRAICSTLIAEAFERVGYPILPRIELGPAIRRGPNDWRHQELLHIRHFSLYAPADFDISPYFQIVKPGLDEGFDYKALTWGDGP